jgi:putative SOS response-associated peptidase YedK
MCGRYANFLAEQDLIDAFAIATVADEVRLLPPSWNIAPTQRTVIVRQSAERERTAEVARWGLVPGWAKDPSIGSKMFNARSETIAEKPSFRSAFAKRRCIVPANGYYEWQVVDGTKTPQYIHAADGSPLAFAGLVEFWKDQALGDAAEWLVSCSIVTAASRDAVRAIHDRQPVMLAAEEVDVWLDVASTKDDLFAAIAAPMPQLAWHAVGKAVGNVRVNEPELIEPTP